MKLRCKCSFYIRIIRQNYGEPFWFYFTLLHYSMISIMETKSSCAILTQRRLDTQNNFDYKNDKFHLKSSVSDGGQSLYMLWSVPCSRVMYCVRQTTNPHKVHKQPLMTPVELFMVYVNKLCLGNHIIGWVERCSPNFDALLIFSRKAHKVIRVNRTELETCKQETNRKRLCEV